MRTRVVILLAAAAAALAPSASPAGGAPARDHAQAVTPALQATPLRVPRGGFLTLIGSGWPASVPVRVLVGPAGGVPVQVARTVTDAQGRFLRRVRVPAATPLGPRVATACRGAACRLTATAEFRVVRPPAARVIRR